VLQANGFKVADLNVTGDEGQNLSLIGAYLQKHTDLVGIVGLGNPAANPAANYVDKNHLQLPVATFDVGKEAAQWIQKGSLTMAINQQPYLQSYFAVANLALQIKFGLQPANVDTGTQIVDKSNIGQVNQVIESGRG
jgi:simple sugar transport system substrate-binding protein